MHFLFSLLLYNYLWCMRKTQSFEDRLWEAWACLWSSSTHLKQRTRVERVIGFVLAIWGILFYSRLLGIMTERFRVHSWIICAKDKNALVFIENIHVQVSMILKKIFIISMSLQKSIIVLLFYVKSRV